MAKNTLSLLIHPPARKLTQTGGGVGNLQTISEAAAEEEEEAKVRKQRRTNPLLNFGGWAERTKRKLQHFHFV